jgi:phage-related protein
VLLYYQVPSLLPKPLLFVGSSKKDLRDCPDEVKDMFGAALLDAQYGDHPVGARPFGEGLPRQVMKLTDDYDGDTYRAAYTVAFPECVYVLHVFKKKSTSGISTPRPDKDLVLTRWKAAQQDYAVRYGRRQGQ